MVFIRRRNNHVCVKKESLLSAVERNFLKIKSHLRRDFFEINAGILLVALYIYMLQVFLHVYIQFLIVIHHPYIGD
jgi:hypothetical protein